MRRFIIIYFVLFTASSKFANFASGDCSGKGRVNKVYVIRHPLREVPKGMKLCPSVLSHSALLLDTVGSKKCILEFLRDGTHLYDAKPRSTQRCPFPKSCLQMRMPDDSGKEFLWERSLHGQYLPGFVDVTPQKAREQMQRIMGNHYNIFFNNCHMAQQRLREKWGLTVKNPFKLSKVFCLCFRFCKK